MISRCRSCERLIRIDASCKRRERGDSVWLLSTLGRAQNVVQASGEERNLDCLLRFRTRSNKATSFRSPSTWDLSRDSITQITPNGADGNYLHKQLTCPHKMPDACFVAMYPPSPFAKELITSAFFPLGAHARTSMMKRCVCE